MSRRPLTPKEVQNPDRILSNLLRDYVEGRLDTPRVLYRAVVVQVDHLGGQLEQEPPNPKNSIKARIVTNGYNSYTSIEDLPVLWPLFPHQTLPVKETEHVYVIFEDEKKQHGLWFTRIAEPKNVDSTNLTPGSKKYLENSQNDLSAVSAEKAAQDIESEPDPVKVSQDFTVEQDVPFTARVGDYVLRGSNNTLLVLGRDRPSDIASGEKSEAGTIDLVTGRTTPEHNNAETDKSRITISAKTDVDGNFNISVGDASGPSAAIAIKSDQIRIVARNGMKLVVEGGKIHIDAQEILMGANAEDPAILGQKFVDAINPLLDALKGPAVAALGSIPLPAHPTLVTAVNTFQQSLPNTALSKKNKVE